MPTGIIEVDYQVIRTLYCFRVSSLPTQLNQVYNTASQVYEVYNVSNWALYAIAIPEVMPGTYRVLPPAPSLATPATEYIYEQKGGSPASTDVPSIGVGNSQGVNVGTVNGVQSSVGSSPTTDAFICNLALNHLGQAQLTTLSDPTEIARRCTLIYATCRDEVLRAAQWKFASVIDTLTNLPSEPLPVGWGFVYQFPTDCLLIRKVFFDDLANFDWPYFPNSLQSFNFLTTNPYPREFKLTYLKDTDTQGILTNFSPAYIEYTLRMTDSTLFDASFVKALSYKLAYEMADVLTGNPQKTQQMMQMYNLSLSDAQKFDSIQDNVPQRGQSKYVDVR